MKEILEFKGRLIYTGWSNPWRLLTDEGEIDLWPLFDQFFLSLDGKPASQERGRDNYTLRVDEKSKSLFEYVPDEYILLKEIDGVGISNVFAYLDTILIWLTGRKVEIEIIDGERIEIRADKSEKVYGVSFREDTNSWPISRKVAKKICKIGKKDCCIFLSVGQNAVGQKGFFCMKFDTPFARILLDRFSKRKIHGRIGNCGFLGWEKQTASCL